MNRKTHSILIAEYIGPRRVQLYEIYIIVFTSIQIARG